MPIKPVFQMCLIAILLPTLWIPSAWAEQWPTTRFEVIQGSDFDGTVKKALIADAYSGAFDIPTVPLTPELKTLIEQYLTAVSTEYEEWGLPAPFMDIIKRPDGSDAYRVQYYDTGGPYALFGPACSTVKRSTIHLNASKLTRKGRITNKGYVDLAHELFHATQRASAFGRSDCNNNVTHGEWVTEGLAEAIGQDVAWEIIGHNNRGMELLDQQQRWGLRNYSKPLNIPLRSHRDDKYQSSSFWRYLAELKYQQLLKRSGNINGGAKPGPDKHQQFEQGETGTDYSYTAKLLSAPMGSTSELAWLEGFLESNFGATLSHIYIDFVSVLAEYGRYRVEGELSLTQREAAWRNNAFKYTTADASVSCVPVSIGLSVRSVSLTVDLDKVSTRCIELDVGDTKTPLRWVTQVVAQSKEVLMQVRLGMAGGQDTITSQEMNPLAKSSGIMATAFVTLQPNLKQYLLVANVADDPWRTKAQTVQLYLTLEGSIDNVMASKAGTVSPVDTPANHTPGPAGATQAHQQATEEIGHQPLGVGTADWAYNDATEFCTRKSRARGNCQTQSTLTFKSDTSANNFLYDLSLNAIGNVNSMADGLAGMKRAMEFEATNDGTKLELVIAGIDYGFKGTIKGVDVRVSGANESAGLRAWRTTAISPTAPCVWGDPTGRVTIEEFTPHILRGTYEAALISSELPPADFRGKCPKKSVVKQATGSFVVAAPWMDDHRNTTDMSWMREDIDTNLNEVMPLGMSIEMSETEGAEPTVTMGGNVVQESDFDGTGEYGTEDCKCTCEEYQKGMIAMRQMMMGGAASSPSETMHLLACTDYCAANIAKLNCTIEMD